MAPSRALRRICSEQSQKHASIIPQRSNKRPVCHKMTTASESSCRPFSTSISYNADESTPGSTETQSGPSFRYSSRKLPLSINLSGITSNPDYQPPKPRKSNTNRNQVITEASLKSLDNLLDKSRQNTPAETPSPTSYNSDVYSSRRRTAQSQPQPPSHGVVSSTILGMVEKSKRASAERTGLPFNSTHLSEELQSENNVVLRLKPSLGRSVTVNQGADLTRAFQTLEGKINGRGNAVRRDEKDQKFHVRAGQAKKINRRMRWRALFKQGYIAELTRVRKMIKQGW